ncbi:MAG: arginine--tRNA ligase [Mycoplasma sp.]
MIIEQVKKQIDAWLEKNGISNSVYAIDKSKNIKFGDFNTNVAMLNAKSFNTNPMELAERILEEIEFTGFKEVTVTKPGFINFIMNEETITNQIIEILKEEDNFGKFDKKEGTFSVEYVSANPTGFLHIGHARNGVLGNCILNLLKWYGYNVVSEYVVNDAGNQMNNLATAVFIRYLQEFGQDIQLPEDSYHGEEIIDVAKKLVEAHGDKFINNKVNENGRIDNPEVEHEIRWFARDLLLQIIKDDLASLGIEIEHYFSEYQSHQNGMIPKMMDHLIEIGAAYKKDDAIWLETTKYGDDKDRVLIKSDGVPTYFAPDIVYHDYKWKTNGTNYLINIWGADHYSYVKRMQVAMQCLGYNPKDLIIVCMQMVKLVKDGEPFKMSKRTGQSLTLKDLVQALGKDASRWYLLSQSADKHLVIDVGQATNKDNKNPIYYVQYAHARANQLINKQNMDMPSNFNGLNSEMEREIIAELEFFKYTIENCAKTYEPYKMTVYLFNLAKLFHSYYSNTKVFDTNNPVGNQQYFLIKAIKQVIHNGLKILGIDPVEKM